MTSSSSPPVKPLSPTALTTAWQSAWPHALSLWSKFTQLSEPRWCWSESEEKEQGLQSSFAMIRLNDQAVVVSLRQVQTMGLEDYPLEVLGHEIGHHVFCPGDLTEHGLMLAAILRQIKGFENAAGLIANLFSDLLINDRLVRQAQARMHEIYQKLMARNPQADPLWSLYMRIYEILWALPRQTLCAEKCSDEMEGDAQLGARLVRVYSREAIRGAGLFAAMCFPYLAKNQGKTTQKILEGWLDTQAAGEGDSIPGGLVAVNPEELDTGHPALDPRLNPIPPAQQSDADQVEPDPQSNRSNPEQQCREPFELGAILRAMGLKWDDHDVAARYYKERALPHLVPFPQQIKPETEEPQMEGLEPWDIGSPFEEADWFQSVLISPHPVPGITTVKRVYGKVQGANPQKIPLDLDLYIDCSGSMPNPIRNTSYLALAGAIMVLSALRVGARVQATLWSGPRQFDTTFGFISDEKRLMRVLTGFFGGGTAFPLHILRDTYEKRTSKDRPAHILVISDEGVDTLFNRDEKGQAGEEIAQMALANARGGCSLVLNLYRDWQKINALQKANSMGMDIYPIKGWPELEAFARAFSKKLYEEPR
ncbi:MAG: VWA domain-containing protein [Acidobacteria bacterium]|nr:VWA domain-containing protein [Acidobacteriota bacterium]MCB9399408.1 VWA domain-containing protein [Acidobacteriota bacterium]